VIEYGYPVTTNNDRFADFSLGMAREVAGPKATVELPHPVMGAEDFSYVLNEVPGAMVFLGGTPHGSNLSKAAPNHSNRVFFEESAMATGIALYASTALRKLAVT
jgi:hippurate hydrolase